MGASLATGHVEDEKVTCPWHAWQYDVTTGKSNVNESMSVGCHEVKVEGDDVLVLV